MQQVSIIIPTLNEAEHILDTLKDLEDLRRAGHEVIVVDGGSTDDTMKLVAAYADKLISSPKGRARQMNAGAEVANGELLWFLHADTRVPGEVVKVLWQLSTSETEWGRFNVHLSGKALLLRLVEAMMNLRSCVTGIATGDQGIFVNTELFNTVGRYPDIPLMEDIALSKALKQVSRPVCLKQTLITSSRRWEEQGILRTIFLMWRLRFAYFLGASPEDLARRYYS